MRLFIGIKIDNKALQKIDNIQKLLYNDGIRGNFTSKNLCHLTLAFLGEIEEYKVSELIDIISSIDSSKLKEIKFLNIELMNQILILKVLKTKELDAYHTALTNELLAHGFNFNYKSFFPHVTLVRESNKDYNKEFIFTSEVTKITLFESKRINGVLTYTPLN